MNKNFQNLLLVGGIVGGLYFAWETNFMGIQDMVYGVAEEAEYLVNPESELPTYATNIAGDELSYYPIGTAGSHPQTTHKEQYSFPYPYPPTQYPATHAPTTLPAAHYQLAGTPNIRQYPGTTTIMSPPPASMPNPTLWFDKGGITSSNRIAMPTGIDYGPYKFDAPIFSSQRYPVTGTNIDYPFIIGPTGPQPCPIGEYRATDGRCYKFMAPPPESCPSSTHYRASDGRCYPFR